MKCQNNLVEIDYYQEIVDFYANTSETTDISCNDLEQWTDHSYIRLMHDIKYKKALKDGVNVNDVVKNSIILILNLFDEKCQVETDISIDNLTEEEKKCVRTSLEKLLE